MFFFFFNLHLNFKFELLLMFVRLFVCLSLKKSMRIEWRNKFTMNEYAVSKMSHTISLINIICELLLSIFGKLFNIDIGICICVRLQRLDLYFRWKLFVWFLIRFTHTHKKTRSQRKKTQINDATHSFFFVSTVRLSTAHKFTNTWWTMKIEKNNEFSFVSSLY